MKKLLGLMAVAGGLVIAGCSHNAEESTAPAPLPQQPAPMAPVSPTGDTDHDHQTTTETTTDENSRHVDTGPPDNGGTTSAAPNANQPSTPPPPIKPATNYPMGIVIPGKKGFVKSPYAEYAEPVDVRGYPPGTDGPLPLHEQDLHRSPDLDRPATLFSVESMKTAAPSERRFFIVTSRTDCLNCAASTSSARVH